MNVLQRIVNERIQSAMILEDDADWSPFIKDQLFEMATGLRAIQKSPEGTEIPYGHNWDFLWLGHNRIGPTDETQDLWILENDFTVPPHKRRNSRWRQSHLPDEVRHNDTRLYFKAYAGMCLYGYAVTYEGARKILSSVSAEPRNQPVDQSLSDMCRGKMAKGFDCYGVYPPLMATHRAAGYKSKDSDINSNERADWHDAYTFDVPFSTMMSISRLADGISTLVSQWKESDVQTVQFDLRVRRPSTGYLKTIDFKSLPVRESGDGY
jgi:GR25 family glycosyltransferase involved in LPS biosynthesis